MSNAELVSKNDVVAVNLTFKLEEKSLIPVTLNVWVDVWVHIDDPYEGTQVPFFGTRSVGTCTTMKSYDALVALFKAKGLLSPTTTLLSLNSTMLLSLLMVAVIFAGWKLTMPGPSS